MAVRVGVSLRTGPRALRSATCAGRQRRCDLGDSGLNPSKAFLLERWKAGGHAVVS